MFGRPSQLAPSPLMLVGGLTVLVLASMAVAIPPAPIERDASAVECGVLVGHGRVSSNRAELAARNGFTYLAIDFTNASFADDALWREYVTEISLRQFPIWGWVDVSSDAGMSVAQTVGESLRIEGLFVYGRNALSVANSMREARPDLRIIAVGPGSADAAVVDKAPTAATGISILNAATSSADKIAAARAEMTTPYLISYVVLPSFN